MNRSIAKNNFIQALTSSYDLGEAQSITRIVFEDEFSIKNGLDFSVENQKQLTRIQTRLLNGEPLQYILGQADFFGLKLKVTPAVLIPRQETEELVALVIETCGKQFDGSILDIGAGSGCIPIALKKHLTKAQISACDISKEALAVAEKNAQKNQLDIHFFICDILNQERRNLLSNYDVIISNPPYIHQKESILMPDRVKDHEPKLALFVENEDALLFYRQITDFALHHLNPKGNVFFELNEYNASEVAQLVKGKDFQNVQIHRDLNGKDRMLSAYKS